MKDAVLPGAEVDKIVEEEEGANVKDDAGCWDFGGDDEDDKDVSSVEGREEEIHDGCRLLEPGPDAGDSGEATRKTDMDDEKALEMAAAVSEEGEDKLNCDFFFPPLLPLLPPPTSSPTCWDDSDDEPGAVAMDARLRRLVTPLVDAIF